MALILAFLAGAAAATALTLHLVRGGRGEADALLGALREELLRFEAGGRELAGELGTRLRTLADQQSTVLARTSSLTEALRRPGVRGRWGELTLRNVVEAAGLAAHVDFDEQPRLPGEEGSLRPDLVVRLPGGGRVAVDAKVPLDAYLDAAEAESTEGRTAALDRHVRAVRERMRDLAGRRYPAHLPRSPEMVVMFLASEAAFAGACAQDPTLLQEAARHRVVIATPATMLALLQVVALGWREESLSEHAERVRRIGGELVSRVAAVSEHLARQGRALESAVQAHNSAVGSFENRLLVSARRMSELGVGPEADALAPAAGVPSAVRMPAAASRPPVSELPIGAG